MYQSFFTLFSILKDNCILLNGKDYLNLITFFNVELGKLSILLRANKLSLNVSRSIVEDLLYGLSQS